MMWIIAAKRINFYIIDVSASPSRVLYSNLVKIIHCNSNCRTITLSGRLRKTRRSFLLMIMKYGKPVLTHWANVISCVVCDSVFVIVSDVSFRKVVDFKH